MTSFFYFGKIGFSFLVSMMFLYRHSGDLEKEKFANRPGDYLFMLIFGAGMLLVCLSKIPTILFFCSKKPVNEKDNLLLHGIHDTRRRIVAHGDL